MLKETKRFTELRQTHTRAKLAIVEVECVGGGRANDCSNNALDVAQKMNGNRPITGWIICASGDENNFDVIQHWWNCDADGNHFDTTPSISGVVEYVMDLDLYRFAFENYDAIDSVVASSIQIRGGKIIAVEEELGVGRNRKYREIEKLDNKSLYNLR